MWSSGAYKEWATSTGNVAVIVDESAEVTGSELNTEYVNVGNSDSDAVSASATATEISTAPTLESDAVSVSDTDATACRTLVIASDTLSVSDTWTGIVKMPVSYTPLTLPTKREVVNWGVALRVKKIIMTAYT